MSDLKIPIAIDESGDLCQPDDFDSGAKNVKVFCPNCRKKLTPRLLDNKQVKHFSHPAGSNCSIEKIIHKLGKKIISDAIKDGLSYLLPNITESETGVLIEGTEFNKKKSLFDSAKDSAIRFTEALEEYVSGGQVFDVFCRSEQWPHELAIEIYVTHKKSSADIAKFVDKNLNAIEIDLSRFISEEVSLETLTRHVLEGFRYGHKWLFCSKRADLKNETLLAVQKLTEANNKIIENLFYDELSDARIEPVQVRLADLYHRDSYLHCLLGEREITFVPKCSEIKRSDNKLGFDISVEYNSMNNFLDLTPSVTGYQYFKEPGHYVFRNFEVTTDVFLDDHGNVEYLELGGLKLTNASAVFQACRDSAISQIDEALSGVNNYILNLAVAKQNRQSILGLLRENYSIPECSPYAFTLYKHHWNCMDIEWKSLFLWYITKVSPEGIGLFNVEELSKNDVFRIIFKFSDDRKLVKRREGDLVKFLGNMTDNGWFVQRISRNQFSINSEMLAKVLTLKQRKV